VTDDPVLEALPHAAASTAIIPTIAIISARFDRIRFVASSSSVTLSPRTVAPLPEKDRKPS
jgi:hypothetical protein